MIPVIDIFAGPGGLGEGFSSVLTQENKRGFELRLSIEKDPVAHKTLELRTFCRQFPPANIPDAYYSYLRAEISRNDLFANKKYQDELDAVSQHVWLAELGAESTPAEEVDNRIQRLLGKNKRTWVLIGGPPCQAYSIVGRSRMMGANPEKFQNDKRHFLYKEYLRILARHQPAVFVFENVKGILSSRTRGQRIFDTILNDLRFPVKALSNTEMNVSGVDQSCEYNIYSFVSGDGEESIPNDFAPKEFVVKSEKYGIPQTRHRVILVGVRSDIKQKPGQLIPEAHCSMWDVIKDMPPIRSSLSREPDSHREWMKAIQSITGTMWYQNKSDKIKKIIDEKLKALQSRLNCGAEFVPFSGCINQLDGWYVDKKLLGVCNHTSRGHIRDDLKRYFYISCFGLAEGRSPRLADLPEDLLPKHNNVEEGVYHGKFSDRFRVQLKGEPAKTITSHIGKDGHYFIHPDPSQCRSLTVREAARIQTFPDNYFFEGSRTQQYIQVGNAVPPLLAKKIAEIVYKLFQSASKV